MIHLRRLVSDAAGTKASSLLLPIPFVRVSALASMQWEPAQEEAATGILSPVDKVPCVCFEYMFM